MSTRVYELARELGVSSKKLMSALSEKGVELRNHLASLTSQDESLARTLFSSGAIVAEPEPPRKTAKKRSKKKTPEKSTVAAAAPAGPDPVGERISVLSERLDGLETLCREVARILKKRKDSLDRIRRAAARAQAPGKEAPEAAETTAVEEPVEKLPEEPVPATLEKAAAPPAEPSAAPPIEEEVPAPREEKEPEAASAEVAEEQAEPVPEVKKPPKPKKPRRVVSVTDRLGGPKPVITRPATPLSRPPARTADGRRRPTAPGTRERAPEAARGEPGAPGAPAKPGARGRPRGGGTPCRRRAGAWCRPGPRRSTCS